MYVFKALGSAPSAAEHPNASRWYTHIASWSSEHASLPGSSTAGESFVKSATEAAKPAEDDDDEVDLFGSDDEEEDAEAERIKAERVKAYQEKKAGKPKTVAKVCARKTSISGSDPSHRYDVKFVVRRDYGCKTMGR